MSVKIISRKRDSREVTIKLVDGSLIKGKVNLHHDEHMLQRVSEIFTQIDEPFLVIYDATFEGKSDRVLIINKRNIVWASPEND
jgi:small nuclear ribonucleoprotein (snRNP)-like protein